MSRLHPARSAAYRNRLTVITVALLAACVLLVPAASASAKRRTVPQGFFGTVLNPEILYPQGGAIAPSVLDRQTGLMARSGVESLRSTFDWGLMEPQPGVYNFAATDELVAAAARGRISILANVIYSPQWASANPGSFQFGFYGPAKPQNYANFLKVLIARYGTHGAFWKLEPGLPKDPIRNWQIWNEEAANFFWVQQPWPKTYTKLLRAAYPAIHHAERGATVVAGSLVGVGSDTPWAEAKALYKAGARRYFDELSVHPFTIDPKSAQKTVNRVIEILGFVRAQMRHYGDAHKPLIITELAWPAALGHVPKSRLLGLETTTKGEQARLSAAYSTLGREHTKLGLKQVYWFTWASTFKPTPLSSNVSYDYAGLEKYTSPSTFIPQAPLTSYTRIARKLEGCTKTSVGRCK